VIISPELSINSSKDAHNAARSYSFAVCEEVVFDELAIYTSEGAFASENVTDIELLQMVIW